MSANTAAVVRCPWCGDDPLYQNYHDQEWGVPVLNDRRQFEFLILETMQAGLSWYLILKKRENFRRAFSDFDVKKVAAYDDEDMKRLLNNTGIIRNRLKISAAVGNAQAFMRIQEKYGTFSRYLWDFVDGRPLVNTFSKAEDVPAFSPLSEKISRELKKAGFKFVGPIVVYSHLQATGLINDHLVDCFRYRQIIDSAKISLR